MIEDQTEATTAALKAHLLAPAPGAAGRPPLSSACSESCQTRCKLKNLEAKRTVRVPAISSTVSDIPADEHSWRMYGQKQIRNSDFSSTVSDIPADEHSWRMYEQKPIRNSDFRGYYKCSTVRGCPARKMVEFAMDDPSVLILTYEGVHNHAHGAKDLRTIIITSL